MTPEKTREAAGTVPITYTGDSLYFTHEGGTFEGDGVSGSYATSVGGAALVVTVGEGSDRATYECRAEDVVRAAIADFKQRKDKR